VVLGVALASVGFVALRNRVMFKLGIRNIPRRRSQTVLIVLGLMLSTLIISAAFTTGDTVNRSVTNEVYSVLGSLDETIFARGVNPENIDEEDENTVNRDVSFSAQDGAAIVEALRSEPSIDAAVPVYADVSVGVNPEKRLSTRNFFVIGLDPQASASLPDIETTSGRRATVAELGPGEAYIDESAADDLNLHPGDSVQIIAFGKTTTF